MLIYLFLFSLFERFLFLLFFLERAFNQVSRRPLGQSEFGT